MRQRDFVRDMDDASLLAEPVRRRLYDYVFRSGREIGRDEAAKASRIERALAAFHLDKLVAAGFLEAGFRRLKGRGGSGVGRPAKVYRRSGKRIDISMPASQYELLAGLLARAAGAGGTSSRRELGRGAADVGSALGQEARSAAGRHADRAGLLRAGERVLAAYGFNPRADGPDVVRLANCPFDAIAQDHRELVCGMNRELMGAFVRRLGATGTTVELDPRAGVCCVALRTHGASSEGREVR